NPEVEIKVDPEKAAKAGLSPVQVSGSLGSLLGGSTVTTLGDTPVVVGVPEGSLDSLDEVRGLPVGSDTTRRPRGPSPTSTCRRTLRRRSAARTRT
ncbi:MAG: AcrB/AcrD/AcrF family, partial [Rubrobacteraceae bacterium]|nr:AcrB/AcrD/AcrF family [Rubrobacteraceae bacterium]